MHCFPAVFLAISLALVPDIGRPDTPTDSRRAFLDAVEDIQSGQSEHRSRPALDGYVLAPYVEHAQLVQDLRQLSHERARQFLAAESSTALGVTFRRQYLAELARRGDWRGFLAFDIPDVATGTTVRCQRLQALLATGRGDETQAELGVLWLTGQSLPDTCDDPIAYGRSRGWIGSEQIWERLRLAARDGNGGLARYLARLLPAGDKPAGERLARAVADPGGTLDAATGWHDTPLEREAVAVAIRRRARGDIDHALARWRTLAPRFGFAPAEERAILRELALYAAVSFRADADEWFARVPQAARSEQLRDWQLRAALAAGDWPAVLAVAGDLPAEPVDNPRARYWLARALEQQRRQAEAKPVYASLAAEANYYGFLAADRIDSPYALCPREIAADEARAAALRQHPAIARALELHAVGWRTEAALAWNHAQRDLELADQRQVLLLASQQGWHDRVVYALSEGENLQHYTLRFPVDQRPTVERAADTNGLDPALTFALIRAESAWQPDARSPANAYGLMQLLPATGRTMARQLGMTWHGVPTLLDPALNIRLGTRYLARQIDRFGGNPWLATAAYNAGPAPVGRWLAERGELPADAFIETIPYGETRDYVARVLAFSVIYDWRLYGKARPLSSRLPDPRADSRTGPRPASRSREFTCPTV